MPLLSAAFKLTAYATWLATDNTSYGPILKLMSGMFDKTMGHQPHRVDGSNRIQFLPVVATRGPQERRSSAADHTPYRGINPAVPGAASPQRLAASAGATARALTSPSKPGDPKAPRYVDVTRPVVSGVNHAAAAPTPAPPVHPHYPGYPPYPAYPPWGYPPFPGYPPHTPSHQQ